MIDREILRQLENNKRVAENTARENLQQALSNPVFKQGFLKVKELELNIAKCEYMGKNCDELRLKLEIEKNNLKRIMRDFEINEDDLKPKYFCEKCKDTGYIGGELCSCYKTLLNRKNIYDLNKKVPKDHTFAFTDFSIFGDNENIKKSYNILQRWCKKEDSPIKHILLIGETGVGKTYLLHCMANELIRNDFSVEFYSSFELNELFLKYHTTFDEQKESILCPPLTCDALIIDDLGVEPKYRNVTDNYLYFVIDSRIKNKKRTVIATNLSAKELMETYEERIYSRLTDKKNSLIINLKGKDLRQKRKD